MNQKERFKKSGENQYYLQEARDQLELSVGWLNNAIWYCKESGLTDDGDRNLNLSNESYFILENAKKIHDYWQEIYDENDNF